MSRSRGLWLAPSALALLAVGCAHCDKCDDFPGPSPTVPYEGSYTPAVSSGQVVSGPFFEDTTMSSPVGTMTTVPPTAAIPGPFTATPTTNDIAPPLPAGAGTSTTPATTPSEPPLPDATLPLAQPPSSPPAPTDGLSRRS